MDIALRELESLHLKKTEIVVAPDDALFILPTQLNEYQKKDDHVMRVGLSLHEWSVDEAELRQQLCTLAAMSPHMRFVLIPHVFDRSGKGDLEFRRHLTSKIDPSSIKTFTLPHVEEESSIRQLVDIVMKETAQIDLMIATRYHAIVFALSSGVPTVACFGDEYYRIKNEGVLDMFFGNSQTYTFDLRATKKGGLARHAIEALTDREEIASRIRGKMLSWESYHDEYYRNLYHTYAICN